MGVDVTEAEVRVPGARLYTETRGSGPLLLMIVGGNGDPTSYAGVADRLAARRTVVSWARRGFVRSPLDAPPPPDTAGRLAADVADAAALIRAHGAPATSDTAGGSGADGFGAEVFGSSSGAIVTLELMARHPALVRTAVVHEPPTLDLLPDPQEWRDRFAAIAATYAQRGTGPAMAEFAAAVGLGPLAGPRTGGAAPPQLAELPGGHVGYAEYPAEFAAALENLL